MMLAPSIESIKKHTAAIDAVDCDGSNCNSNNNNGLNDNEPNSSECAHHDSTSSDGDGDDASDDDSSHDTFELQEELESWQEWTPSSVAPGIDHAKIKAGLVSAIVAAFFHVIGLSSNVAPIAINPQDEDKLREYEEIVS